MLHVNAGSDKASIQLQAQSRLFAPIQSFVLALLMQIPQGSRYDSGHGVTQTDLHPVNQVQLIKTFA